MRAGTVLPALLLLFAPIAAAFASDVAPKPTVIRDVGDWVGHQRDVRAEFETAKRWAHVKPRDKERLYAAQDQAFALLDGRASVDELSTDQKLELYNAQGVIASVLTEAELDREVCKRETLVGSHRSGLVCMTVREKRRIQEMDHDMLMAPRNCRPTGQPDDPCDQG